MARARKLYYNVVLTGPSAAAVVAPTTTADRDGNLLDALPGLLGTATAEAKARQELTAIYVPYGGTQGTTIPVFFCTFLRNGTDAAVYYTDGGGGTTSIPTKAGSSAAFTTNPRVRVRHYAAVASARVFRGTLYIQRQHSIEC
jgi:hypothetical protein